MLPFLVLFKNTDVVSEIFFLGKHQVSDIRMGPCLSNLHLNIGCVLSRSFFLVAC